MYIEKKDGDIDGAAGRIGWVTVSSGGSRVYYRGRTLTRAPTGLRGTYVDEGSGHAYWVTSVRKTGSHAHFSPRVPVRDTILTPATSTGASAPIKAEGSEAFDAGRAIGAARDE